MRTVRSSPTVAAAVFACALAGCYAPPTAADRRTPLGKVQRVFASDLSTTGFAQRSKGLSQAVDAAPAEVARIGKIPDRTSALADRAGPRIEALTLEVADGARSEIARVDDLAVPGPVWSGADRAAADFAAALADVPTMLGLDRRPLGEPSDREHRTDPNDDRPEATLWQRLARRLGL